MLDLVGEQTELVVAAEEELAPAFRDHWSDVSAAFGDDDAHHLYVSPESITAALGRRARIWLSAISGDQPIALRAQSADTAARSLAEAEPELEKLVRSGYRTRYPEAQHVANVSPDASTTFALPLPEDCA